VESGPAGAVLARPAHPYTRALLNAVIDLGDPAGTARPIPGTTPDLARVPDGCAFHPRCPLAGPECRQDRVPLLPVAGAGTDEGRLSACLHSDQVSEL
jgi:peptide/nickel transport system ATP-binding protein